MYKPVSFTSHHTYLGLPQLKAYNMIDIYFQLKTSDEDGLILYNGGKGDDFVAVELIRGHIHYTFNMGYRKIKKEKLWIFTRKIYNFQCIIRCKSINIDDLESLYLRKIKMLSTYINIDVIFFQ